MTMVPLLAQATSRTFFEWGRIQSNADWIAPIGAFVALLVFARFWYLRDAAELRGWQRLLLTTLRAGCFAGLLWIYLEPQWRTERDVTTNSQAVVLVDTSLSMGLPDESFPSTGATPSRAERAIQALKTGRLINELRRTHDVSVLRFDQELQSVRELPKLSAQTKTDENGLPLVDQDATDWDAALNPRGVETRLSQALSDVINERRRGPLSGIVVLTDGSQNSGPAPISAIRLAQEAGVRLHPIGLGSNRQPINVRISDFVVPARAFPNDSYTVTGYLQSQGLSDRTVHVELLSAPADDARGANPTEGRLEAATDVRLPGDGEIVPVRFEVTPDETGRRTLTLRVEAPADDSNPNDNRQQADLEVVDQRTRVLLFASGPTREYRFLHALLFRDEYVDVDLLLGTAQPGMTQEARTVLERFPSTREELDQYDVIIAIDPDWQSLDARSIANFEHWLAEQAGGLILIAGPIYSDSWAEKPELAKIRDMYPVEFRRRFSLAGESMDTSVEPCPLEFTRDGMDAEFLALADSPAASQEAWATVPGFYACLEVRAAKPGATIYANFDDPRHGAGERLPYLCGQFYGSGRVFYMGSGEMWRLRGINADYFEQFYTKLIRNVAQGRLVRGSSRGVLLTERDRYLLGQTVELRAQLSNAQLEPLSASDVTTLITLPDNSTLPVKLEASGARPGNFSGQFVVQQEGVYRIDLELPDSSDHHLTKRINVRVPDLERENPVRNDVLLNELAASTGGHFYIGVEDGLGLKGAPPLWQQLPDRTLTHPESERPKPLWDNWLVMAIIVGCLSLEWLLRRLMKLA